MKDSFLGYGFNYYLISIGFLISAFLVLFWPGFPIWIGFFIIALGATRIPIKTLEEKEEVKQVLIWAYGLSLWALIIFFVPFLHISLPPTVVRVLWAITQLAQLQLVRLIVTWFSHHLELRGQPEAGAKYQKDLTVYTIFFLTASIGNILASIRGRQEIMAFCFVIFFACSLWMFILLSRLPKLLAQSAGEDALNGF